MKIKVIFFIFLFTLQFFLYQSNMDIIKDYKNTPGIQVYHFNSKHTFIYSSWEYSDNKVIGKITIYLSHTHQVYEHGLWVVAYNHIRAIHSRSS